MFRCLGQDEVITPISGLLAAVGSTRDDWPRGNATAMGTQPTALPVLWVSKACEASSTQHTCSRVLPQLHPWRKIQIPHSYIHTPTSSYPDPHTNSQTGTDTYHVLTITPTESFPPRLSPGLATSANSLTLPALVVPGRRLDASQHVLANPQTSLEWSVFLIAVHLPQKGKFLKQKY